MMSKKKIKEKEMSLSYVISLNKKKGMNPKVATREAKIYMLGYTRAKKGSINKATAMRWSKRDKYGKPKKR